MKRTLAVLAVLALGSAIFACAGADEALEAEESAQTRWQAPAEGSCEAKAFLKTVNEASVDALDDDAKLTARVAAALVASRPFATVRAVDDVPSVGPTALASILRYAKSLGHLAACAPQPRGEIGVISDLDKTVIPASTPDLAEAPYPGVKALYTLLESRNGGQAGDVYYVTARTPAKVADVPDYLRTHGVPLGPIETGTSGVPWVAQPEKVRDIKGILQRTGSQKFILFGDTAHRDPEVYKEILAAHPERVTAVFIQKVNATVPEARVAGMVLHESYAEVAAVLYERRVITRAEAKSVMQAAKREGLAITEAEITTRLDGR
jgi:hypothetical protein